MASLSQGGLCYDGQESHRKHLIGFSHSGYITIMDKFLDDDTLESNQWWETDSNHTETFDWVLS